MLGMGKNPRRALQFFFSLTTIVLLLGACSGASGSPTSDPCSAQDWSIDFTRSGGFAGRTRSLHLLSSGALTASEPEQNLEVRSEVSSDDLAHIGQLLHQACPFPAASEAPQSCADCFSYSLQVEMGGQTYLAQATDMNLGGLSPLMGALNSLLDAALTGQP